MALAKSPGSISTVVKMMTETTNSVTIPRPKRCRTVLRRGFTFLLLASEPEPHRGLLAFLSAPLKLTFASEGSGRHNDEGPPLRTAAERLGKPPTLGKSQ